jgi:putative peptide zinc metalloprotease protein
MQRDGASSWQNSPQEGKGFGMSQNRESVTSQETATAARSQRDPLQRPAKRVQNAPRINVNAPQPRISASGEGQNFKQDNLVRQHKPVPRHGWRRIVYNFTFGFVNLGPSDGELQEKETAKRVRTPLKGTRRIAIISRKGGVGKTTTTIMLGHVFAAWRGDRVVALDGNPDAGSLAYRVRRETQKTLSDLLENPEPIQRYAEMRAYTSQAPTRLEVLASDDDPRIATALGEAEYHRAIDLLERHYNILLMDTGTGILDSATRGILDMADQLVVVMSPSVDSARALSLTLDWLDKHGYDALVKSAVAVVNGVRNDSPIELKRMESHFENRVAEIVRIPWDPHLDAGAETAIDELRAATRAAYLQLAAAEAGKFAQPPLARDRIASAADQKNPIESTSPEKFDTSGNSIIDLTDHTAKIDESPEADSNPKPEDAKVVM